MTTLLRLDLRPFDADCLDAELNHAVLPLSEGSEIELMLGADAAAVQARFEQAWPGQFVWQTLGQDAEGTRIRLQRRPAGRSCCGCCGGR